MRFAKSITRLLAVLVVVGAVVGMGALQVKRKQQALSQAPKFAVGLVPVHAVEARVGSLAEQRRYLAIVEPVQTANLAARVTAEVQRVAFDEGDTVKAGDEVVVLDSREIRAHIGAVQAQIRQSEEELQSNQATVATFKRSTDYCRQELARYESLRENKAVSMVEIDAKAEQLQETQGKLAAAEHKSVSIEQAIQSLKSQQTQLETTLDYCCVRSPFDGVLSQRLVDPGDLASPGKTLCVIEDRSQVRLAFEVPQQDLDEIRPGLELTFTVEGKPYRAKLSRLYPSLNLARMLRAEVDLSGRGIPGLTTGAYVPVSLELRTVSNAALVPLSALIESSDGGKTTVFVVDDGRLVLRPVTVLASRNNESAVSGVKPGEQVVVDRFLGWTRYAPGQKVEIVP